MEKEEDKKSIKVEMTLDEYLEDKVEALYVPTVAKTPVYRESEQQRKLRKKLREKQAKKTRLLLHLNVMEEDNEYHVEEIYTYANKRELEIRRVEGTERYLRSLKYPTILETDVLHLIQINNYRKVKDIIQDIHIEGRIIVFVTNNDYIYRELSNMTIKGVEIHAFPKTDTWLEKNQSCQRLLDSWLGGTESSFGRGVKKKLAQLMIQDKNTWQTIKTYLASSEGKVTENDIKNAMKDTEYYTIKEWLVEVTKGQSKRKSLKMTNYFIEKRGYSPNWLVTKWREYIHDCMLVAESYRRGVIQPARYDKDVILQRSGYLSYDKGLELAEKNTSTIREHLSWIKNYDYTHLVEVSRVVYEGQEHNNTKQHLYLAIERVRLLVKQNKQEQEWGINS